MLTRIQKAMKEKDEGFTLIELLVVIIIIGILAAIAIPVFLNQRQRATEASLTSDLRTIANEMETYYTDNQTYPTVATAANKVVVGTTTVTLSKNNTAAAVPVTGGAFCIGIFNSDLGSTKARYYSSNGGGVLPKGQTCGT